MSSRVLNLLPNAIGAVAGVTEYARVAAPAPVSFNDLLHVVFPDWSVDFSFAVPWDAAHGTTLPAVGADALIVKDSRGQRHCVYWDSPTTNFVATSIAGLAAGGGLAGTYPNPTLKLVTGAAWVTPTLTNSWTARSGDPAGYFKDPLGFVRLRGRLTGGASGSSAFTLPVGFRPGNADDLYAAAAYNGSTAVAAFADIVSASGLVSLFYASGATDVGLGGITFLAEN